MLQTNNHKFTKEERRSILALFMLGLFITLVAYMNNSESKPTKENNFKTEIK